MTEYFLTEAVVVRYASEGEAICSLQIIRSKQPRRTGELRRGQTVEAWINENEDLVTRVIYEAGVWNVKEWECGFYISEIADYGINIDNVESVRRVVHYEIPNLAEHI
jgi:hypothetical protein